MTDNEHKAPSWLFNQSAVIPYRINKGALEIMIISSRKKKRWVIPKGVIEKDMTPRESAVQEAYEEAGIKGKVVSGKIGVYTYEKWGGVCSVRVYLFKVDKVLNEWPEADMRDRKWVSLNKAVEAVDEPKLKKILAKAAGLVKSIK